MDLNEKLSAMLAPRNENRDSIIVYEVETLAAGLEREIRTSESTGIREFLRNTEGVGVDFLESSLKELINPRFSKRI